MVGGGGVLRPSGRCKYLREFPIIYTIISLIFFCVGLTPFSGFASDLAGRSALDEIPLIDACPSRVLPSTR